MKVILHIGTEKTGTTSIQQFVGLNEKVFVEKGFCTNKGILNNNNNLELVLACCKSPGADLAMYRTKPYEEYRQSVLEKIRANIDNARRCGCAMIYSSEHFSSRLIERCEIKALKELFPSSTSFEVILYLKRQDALYLGSLAEALKAGIEFNNIPKPDQILSQQRYGRAYYDYSVLLENWSDIFGKKSLKVRVFEKNKLINGDVVSDFMRTLGLSSELFKQVPVEQNKMLPPEILITLSDIYKQYKSLEKAKLLQILEKLERYTKGTLVSPQELFKFYDSFKISNNKVATEYLNSEALFDAESMDLRFFDPSDADSVHNCKKEVINFVKENLSLIKEGKVEVK